MLRDTVEESSAEGDLAPTWAPEVGGRTTPRVEAGLDWRAVDRALRAIRRKRAVLDAEEARWLRAAEEVQIWRPLGMVSALDYMERVLGYAPRTAQDRLRVARALGTLPALSDALASDDLSYSAVRELTRVATPATESAWIEAARGKSLRQIEELVADHKPGDRPDDPPDPEARTRVVRFELSPETFALLRQARTVLDDEHGTNLADDDFVAALCHGVLDGAPESEPTGRARFQIAVAVCPRCRAGWQEGAGARVAISGAAVERAMCDAQHIGSLDGDAPERAHQDIPPAVVRFVWRRDGGRCRVPGCRSARGLEIHHLVHRADGGGHEPQNLALLCSACHLAHHRGALAIGGTADQLEVQRPGEVLAAPRPIRTKCDERAIHANVGSDGGEPVAAPEPSRASRPTDPVLAAVGSNGRAHVGGARHALLIADSEGPGHGAGRFGAAGGRVRGGRADSRDLVGSGADGRGGGVHSFGDHDARTKLDMAVLRTEAKDALVDSGWTPTIARAAVAAAADALGASATLDRLIFESFRRCPKL